MSDQPRVVIVSDRPDPRWAHAGWSVVGTHETVPPTDILICDGPPVAGQASVIALTEHYARLAANAVNRELQQAHSRLNLDLEVARRLQESFLPRAFPEVGRVRFAAARSAHGTVAGDCYDAVRLDEKHVGFYLADAMGHGVPAALLAVYLKKAVVGKEIVPGGYRLLEPAEVLSRLNREMLDLQLAEEPFVTMTYGLIQCDSGRVSLARAAHPAAWIVDPSGRAESWSPPGAMLGVFEAGFTTESRDLQPGDRIVLVTDGLQPDPTDSKLLTEAMRKFRDRPLSELAEAMMQRVPTPSDDATILALEYR